MAKTVCLSHTQTQRGGGETGSGHPPPPKFVRGGILCGCLVGRRGGPNVVFIILLYFFLARFARQYYRKSKCLKNSNHFQVPSPFSQIVIHAISGFYESAFSCLFLSKITQFYTIQTKIFWGRTPRSPPPKKCARNNTNFYSAKTIMSNVFLVGKNTGEVYMKSFVSKAVSMATLDFDPTNPK